MRGAVLEEERVVGHWVAHVVNIVSTVEDFAGLQMDGNVAALKIL